LAVDDHGVVWVAVTHADTLLRLDPSTGSFTTFKLPNRTHPAALLSDPGGRLWFASSGLGLVGRLDRGRVNEFVLPSLVQQKVAGFPTPRALTFDPSADEVWFSIQSNGRVGRLPRLSEPSRRELSIRELPVASSVARLQGIASDGHGGVWVAESGVDRVTRVDVTTATLRRIVLPPGSRPHAVVRGADGRLWFTLFGSHRLLRLDPNSHAVKSWIMPSAPRSSPVAITADRRGALWVAEYDAGPVVRFHPHLEAFAVVRVAPALARVQALAADPSGRVWFVTGFGARLGVIERVR